MQEESDMGETGKSPGWRQTSQRLKRLKAGLLDVSRVRALEPNDQNRSKRPASQS